MDGFVYRCPSTGRYVQGWADDVEPEAADCKQFYIGTRCPACNRWHLVNRTAGEVLGSDSK